MAQLECQRKMPRGALLLLWLGVWVCIEVSHEGTPVRNARPLPLLWLVPRTTSDLSAAPETTATRIDARQTDEKKLKLDEKVRDVVGHQGHRF